MHAGDRIHGALLGTLLGDAFGRPFEGIARHDARLNAAIRARAKNPHGWDYSDDGEMALAVAESIVSRGAVDEAHLLAALAARHEPARGYGKGMRAAFRALETTGDWRDAPHALWAEGSRGNGSAVRVAAVAAWHVDDDDPRVVDDAARRSAAPTHAHPDAVDATRAMALALWRSMRGGPTAELRAWLGAFDPRFRRFLRPRSASGLPLAIESLGVAMIVLDRGLGFADAVQAAVALGHDTDSNAAMAGALAGASLGRRAIPGGWVTALPTSVVREAAELAARLSRGRRCAPNGDSVRPRGWRTEEVSVAASANEDRAWVEADGDSVWIVVADGAGGIGRGAEAAARVIAEVRAARPSSGRAMMRLLEAVDRSLAEQASGLTTAVVARVDDRRVLGASVGDSVAWCVCGSHCEELTEHQLRRPLIGSGRAAPVPFVRSRIDRVLVASDGLGAYVPDRRIESLLEQGVSARALVDAARLPTGTLCDDITVVLATRR